MLKLNIQNAKAKGIQKILVTCDEKIKLAKEQSFLMAVFSRKMSRLMDAL